MNGGLIKKKLKNAKIACSPVEKKKLLKQGALRTRYCQHPRHSRHGLFEHFKCSSHGLFLERAFRTLNALFGHWMHF